MAKYDRSTKGRYRHATRRARKLGVEWALTLAEYEELLSEAICAYCAGPLDPTGSGLDRKDNARGYSRDNIVTCCGECNAIKSNKLSFEEAKVALGAVRGLREAKK